MASIGAHRWLGCLVHKICHSQGSYPRLHQVTASGFQEGEGGTCKASQDLGLEVTLLSEYSLVKTVQEAIQVFRVVGREAAC